MAQATSGSPVGRVLAFFISWAFWRNVLAALALLALLFLLLRTSLNWYTNHGRSMPIPTFEGMHIDEARALADDKGLKLSVTEGAFDPDRPEGGEVVQQQPRVGSRVKQDRTVYLTILSDEAPEILLPGLVGSYDYDRYTAQLEALNINYRVRERVYDAKQERGTILHFYYDDRKITEDELGEGVRVPQGSTLDFVVTKREGGSVALPDYRCKPFGEAEFEIVGSRFVIGEVNGQVANRYNAYISRTDPPAGTMLPTGSQIDVYLTDQRPEGCN